MPKGNIQQLKKGLEDYHIPIYLINDHSNAEFQKLVWTKEQGRTGTIKLNFKGKDQISSIDVNLSHKVKTVKEEYGKLK